MSCAHGELLRGDFERSRNILEANLQVDLLEISGHSYLNTRISPAITLATIHKLDGHPDLTSAYVEIEEGILAAESENGTIESPLFARTKARLLALRDENERAIDELEKLIAYGDIGFRTFMHPVFNGLRSHPRYEALKAHWMDLINAERAKLGYGPLALNPLSGPGQLPFILED